MRKTFLKVAIFSLVAAPMVTSLQSCKDYDDDITEINGNANEVNRQILDLQNQIATLQGALATAQTEAKNAAQAAADARAQADKALKDAADAMAAAKIAQQAGDAAKAAAEEAKAAAAKAQADALAAQALAKDAQAAAAQAKADALAELTKQAQALKDDIHNLEVSLLEKINANGIKISENTAAIAANATAIKANAEKLAELQGKIATLEAQMNSMQSNLQGQIDELNKKLLTFNTADALNAAVNALETKLRLELDNKANKTEVESAINQLNALLNAEVKKLQDEINAINKTLIEQGGNINGLTEEQKRIWAEVQKNAAAIGANTAAINQLIANLSVEQAEIWKAINANIESINGLTNEQKNLKLRMDGFESQLGQLSTTLSELSATVSNNYADLLNKISALAGRTQALEEQVAVLNAFKASMEQNYKELAEKFKNFEQKYQADIDKINGEISSINTQIGSMQQQINKNTQDIAGLRTDLTTVQTDLGNLRTDLSALTVKLAEEIDKVKTKINNDIAAAKQEWEGKLNTAVSNLQTQINGLETRIAANETAIATLNNKVTAIETKLGNLFDIVYKRLTSVTAMPELFVKGLATVEFRSMKFTPWYNLSELKTPTEAQNTWLYVAPKDITNPTTQLKNANSLHKEATYDANSVVVKYQLNPASVATKSIDINNVAYITSKAISRAENDAVAPVQIVGTPSVANGVMSVTVKNNVTDLTTDKASMSSTSNLNKVITIAALKVPIAKEYLQEGEENAAVYSDYVRMMNAQMSAAQLIPSEKSMAPEFGSAADLQANLANMNYVVVDVPYQGENNSINLMPYVNVGCITNTETYTGETGDYDTVLAGDEITTAGFSIKFQRIWAGTASYGTKTAPKYYYTLTEAGQLTCTSEENVVLNAKPVIAAVLYYNGQIVDVKYFKVRFVTDMPDATYDVKNNMKIGENFNVVTGTVVDVKRSITWNELYTNVLKSKVAHNSVTPSNFCSYYDVTIESKRGNVTVPALFSFNASTYNGTTASNANMKKLALQLNYTNAYLALLESFGQTQTFTTTVTFTPNEANTGLYPTITVTYVLTVENPLSFKPELGEYNDITWFPKNITMNGVDYNNIITQYAVPSDPKFAAAGDHPSYKTNILTGRTAPYVYFTNQEAKDSLNNIATWTTSVLPMKKGVNDVYRAAATDGETHYVGRDDVRSTYFDIEHNAEGIEMVSKQFAMVVDWSVYPIGHYNYPTVQNQPISFAQTGVQIVKPLTLNVNNEAVTPIIDNKQTTTNLLDAITVTDYYGNVVISRVDGVAKVLYRDFYGFGESIVVDYDAEGITIDGKSPESMNYSITIASHDLKFSRKPDSSSVVVTPKVVKVPFTIKHWWGEETGVVEVKLLPMD